MGPADNELTTFTVTREQRKAERRVLEAARVLFHGYTAEDQTPNLWATDDQLDYRLRRLFAAVEVLEK
jgi:hypothetical protein